MSRPRFARTRQGEGEKGRCIFSRDTHQNFTSAVGGLSVTHDAAGGDNGN